MSDICHDCGCFECECDSSYPELSNTIAMLKDQLQQSRREGWGQCQREAQTIVEQSRLAVNPLQTIRLRLSEMEYKEI